MTKTSFAVVGTGIVGERIIKQLLANDNAKIIALFDEDKKRLSEMADTYGLRAASSYEEVLSLKPNWVYIGTPPVSHAVLSEIAIHAGLDVLCEKPLANDAGDGLVMAQVAEKSHRQTAMHFPLMYSPSARHMMELVEKGTVGDIVRVELSTYFPHWPRLCSKIHGLVHVNKVDLREKFSRIIFNLCTECSGKYRSMNIKRRTRMINCWLKQASLQ